jgi:hypothetical protein
MGFLGNKQMFWNENKITKSLRMQVNNLSNGLTAVRQQFTHMLGVSHNDNRDIYQEFGYVHNPSFNQLYEIAVEHPMANRLVFGMSKSCWRDGFTVYADDDDDAKEVLDDEITKLNNKGMTGVLERADVLSRIGKFSCLFVGVPDGLPTNEPVGPVSGDGFKSIYFKAFAYDGIEIYSQVQEISDPRFGLPEYYRVQKMARDNSEKDTVLTSMLVHWTRIVHMVENPLDSDVEGIPYLRPVYNTLLDVMKTSGGSSEAFFRNVQRIIVNEIDPSFAATLSSNKEAQDSINESTKNFTNKMQNQIVTSGGKIKQLTSNMASPKDTFMVSVNNICAYSGYPVRAFTGEGGGQYSGEEDQLAVNNLIADRQKAKCAGYVQQVMQILNRAGMVKLNELEDYRFPLQEASTETKKAEVNLKKAQTFQAVMQGMSTPGGDSMDEDSVLASVGLNEIKAASLGE